MKQWNVGDWGLLDFYDAEKISFGNFKTLFTHERFPIAGKPIFALKVQIISSVKIWKDAAPGDYDFLIGTTIKNSQDLLPGYVWKHSWKLDKHD